jgi:hypothetical protein
MAIPAIPLPTTSFHVRINLISYVRGTYEFHKVIQGQLTFCLGTVENEVHVVTNFRYPSLDR